jgi:hypothetical protein
MSANLHQLDAEVENAKKTILHNLPNIEGNTPSVILKLGGAEQAMNKAKSDINMGIETLNRSISKVNAYADSIIQRSKSLTNEIKEEKEKHKKLSSTVVQSETLAQIRKEQAEALKKKHDANLHSSWLGLFRPLADTSRVALFTSGIALIVLFLVSLVYFFWNDLMNIFPAHGGETSDRGATQYENFFGGFRKLNPRK